MLEIRLLGGFEIRSDGALISLASRPAQSLFSYLILNAGTPHRREKLAGLFWPDSTEKRARSSLRHELWRIRKALEQGGAQNPVLSDDLTIAFDAAAECRLDVWQLTRVGGGGSASELMEGLAAYRGELLPGFYEDWLVVEREHLALVFEQGLSRLLELLEAEKRWPEILEWAERWLAVGQQPEAAYRSLMVAYAALGDRTKVLATYRRCQLALEALGIEPSAEIRALADVRPCTGNLPTPMTSFIGREKELDELTSLLLASPLVTLTGPGGVGKTRLAIELARRLSDRFPDGVWFVGAASLSDPALVPQTILSALGGKEQPGRSTLQSVLDHVRGRSMLLVLDNCEHLLPACAAAVQALLSAARGLKIMATSREALGLDGELSWNVPAMVLPDPECLPTLDQLSQYEAVRLFIDRAALVEPGFTVSKANARAIAQICFHLDGIPLAIELAAARMRALSAVQVSARLDDRFQLLTGGKRGALPQHKTLRLTIDWSYNLLSPTEQDMLQRLSVFAGGWSLEAAEALATRVDPTLGDWLDLQSKLVDKSLVSHNVDAERYSMLESVQHYALERLEAGGQLQACRSVHQLYFLELAECADRESWDLDKQAACSQMLVQNLDNLRRALRGLIDDGRADESLRLAGALGGRARGDYAGLSVWETAEWLEQAWALKDKASAAPRARAAHALGVVRWKQGNLAESTARSLESLKIYRDLGDEFQTAGSLMMIAFAAEDTGQAREASEEALRIARRLGHKQGIFTMLNTLGELERAEGNYDAAEKYYMDSLALARDMGHARGEATALGNLGGLAYARQDWVRARELCEQQLPFWHASNDEWFFAMCMSDFANLLFHEGEHTPAARLQGFTGSLCKQIGAPLQSLELEAFEATAAALKHELGEAAYQEALDTGKRLTQDQAIDIALRRV